MLSTLLRRTTVRSALKIHLAQESPRISYHVNHKPSLHNTKQALFFSRFSDKRQARSKRGAPDTRHGGKRRKTVPFRVARVCCSSLALRLPSHASSMTLCGNLTQKPACLHSYHICLGAWVQNIEKLGKHFPRFLNKKHDHSVLLDK